MLYAIDQSGTGYRAVNSVSDLLPGEVLHEGVPNIILPSGRPETVAVDLAVEWLIEHKDGEGVSYWSRILSAVDAMPDGDAKQRLLNGLNRKQRWSRDDDYIVEGLTLAGLSPEQVDELFRLR